MSSSLPKRRSRVDPVKKSRLLMKRKGGKKPRQKVWCLGCGDEFQQKWSWYRHIDRAKTAHCVLVHEYQDSGLEHIPHPLPRPVTTAEQEAMRAVFPRCRDRKDVCHTWERRTAERAQLSRVQTFQGSEDPSETAVSHVLRRSSRTIRTRYSNLVDMDVDSELDVDSDDQGNLTEDRQAVDDGGSEGSGEVTSGGDGGEGYESDESFSPVEVYREPVFAPDSPVHRNPLPFRTQVRIDLHGRPWGLQDGADIFLTSARL